MEANYGESTIQNYDAILRNKPLASRLGVPWRIVLSLMLALPIGLSVAYKTFTGGESKMTVNSVDYISNTTYFGMFQPPGIISSNGVSLFFNATTAFREATRPSSNGTEPPLPTLPTHMDTLQPDYLVAMQELLAIGESWTITAPVIGTVATFNQYSIEDRSVFEETFTDICNEARGEDQWSHSDLDMYTFWSLTLTNRRLLSDQSFQNAYLEDPVYFDLQTFNMGLGSILLESGTSVTYEEVDILYPIDQDSQIIVYNRPTLRKSP
ncbi:hypothetical protein CSAL01_09199 [Colletotrichum salicis]|uniref:Uncharacterized protein n=1 Tax=Colletotrichum salicis TaxID=1209931 RepID=A0A135RTI3_9PEZI|nr:hypothetical protein CSAL01_09199 [Colletotrichum salicis]